jgi:hypothetical protein
MKSKGTLNDPTHHNNQQIVQLRKVVADLKEGEDVEGAVLMGERDFFIACELKSRIHNDDIRSELALINRISVTSNDDCDESIFTCQEHYCNGFKVLSKKVKEKMTLYVVLKKPSYMSLVMLDFENTIRMIDRILNGFIFENTYT